jgi:hypothetical protein
VLWPDGAAAPSWPAIAIAVVAFVLLWRTRVGLLWILAGGLAAGAVLAGG